MHIPLVEELVVTLTLAVVVAVVLAKARLPTVTGLLVAGAIAGPYGLGAIGSVEAIELLAEVGVILLLFTIGLEFSLSRLRHIYREVAIGGALQVGLTGAAIALAAWAAGESTARGVFLGCVLALSSTAIVLRALSEKGELDAPHGRFIVGVLVFQDLCVVPIMLVVPVLAGSASAPAALGAIGLALGKAAAIVTAAVLLARWIVPVLLAKVDASRSREVFVLAVLSLCIGTAWLTSLVGLSLALGAFLGGLVVADTMYGHRAMADILPLRDLFVSVFFVSLGMLFDVRMLLAHPALFGLLLVALLAGKGLLATGAALAMRFPARVAWLAGIGLAQFGEFGFVLTRLGEKSGIITADEMRLLLTAGVATMVLTPLLLKAAPHVTAGERLLAPLARLLGARGIDEVGPELLSGHVVIVGYGVAGRLAANALRASKVRYVVLELNAETVRAAREAGEPVFYADATSPEALRHAHAAGAAAIVLLINDPQAAERVADAARRCAPRVPVLMRTRYLAEVDGLVAAGVAEVVAEELEAGIEILVRLLRRLDLPRNVIEERVRQVRRTHPGQRRTTFPRRLLPELSRLADLKVESVLLDETSPAVGRTALELDVRRRTGALIVALWRQNALLDINPSEPLRVDDTVFMVGPGDAVTQAARLLVSGLVAPRATAAESDPA